MVMYYKFMYGEKFDSINTEFLKIGYFFNETEIRSSVIDVRSVMCGESFEMCFIYYEFFIRYIRFPVILPVKRIIDNDGF